MAMPEKGDVSGILDAVKQARGKLPVVPVPNEGDFVSGFAYFTRGTHGVDAQFQALEIVERALKGEFGSLPLSFTYIIEPLYERNPVVQLKAFDILLSALSGDYGKAFKLQARDSLCRLFHSNRDEVKKLYDSVIIPALADEGHTRSRVLREFVLWAVNRRISGPILKEIARHLVEGGRHSEGLIAWFKQVEGTLTLNGFRAVRNKVLCEYHDWVSPYSSDNQRERKAMCSRLNVQLRAHRGGGMTSFMQELVSQTRRAGVPTQRDLVARVARAGATR